MSQQSPDADPFASFAFVIKLKGGSLPVGYFQEVSGLTAQIDAVEVQEGGRNNATRKLVGQGKFPNLVLKRGFCRGTLFDTLAGFHAGHQRLNGTISMRSAQGDEIATWRIQNGIPIKWDGPQLNATQNSIAVESLEIAHEGLVKVSMSKVPRIKSKSVKKSAAPKSSPPPAAPGSAPSGKPDLGSAFVGRK